MAKGQRQKTEMGTRWGLVIALDPVTHSATNVPSLVIFHEHLLDDLVGQKQTKQPYLKEEFLSLPSHQTAFCPSPHGGPSSTQVSWTRAKPHLRQDIPRQLHSHTKESPDGLGGWTGKRVSLEEEQPLLKSRAHLSEPSLTVILPISRAGEVGALHPVPRGLVSAPPIPLGVPCCGGGQGATHKSDLPKKASKRK